MRSDNANSSSASSASVRTSVAKQGEYPLYIDPDHGLGCSASLKEHAFNFPGTSEAMHVEQLQPHASCSAEREWSMYS
ncbi:MAG: hypothetical protein JNM62_04610 [Flavobacteriales bacterium]|nr:hypothetical protein [Flavobacteriales bacterium]